MIENKTLQILSNFKIFKGFTEDDLKKRCKLSKTTIQRSGYIDERRTEQFNSLYGN
jgi:hypothetical protein